MANNPNQSGGNPPPKPWERAGPSSGPAPFKPPSAGNTSEVVEASGTAKPGEAVTAANRTPAANNNTLTRPLPTRPWQQPTYGRGGFGSNLYNNSGSGLFGSSYGGRGTGLFGSTNRGGYGGLGGYGTGMGIGPGGPNGEQDPNSPFGTPASPPGFWVSLIRVMQGVVGFFGRISLLIDQNTEAFHMLMTALLQAPFALIISNNLFDRSGMLYAELARFVLRLLGIKTKPKDIAPPPTGPQNDPGSQKIVEGPKNAQGGGGWDNVWGNK